MTSKWPTWGHGYRRRQRALLRLQPLARRQRALSGEQEILDLIYRPGTCLPPKPDGDQGNQGLVVWQGALQQQLVHQREMELRLGCCRIGPQRDEVALQLNGQAARRYGFAGQQPPGRGMVSAGAPLEDWT